MSTHTERMTTAERRQCRKVLEEIIVTAESDEFAFYRCLTVADLARKSLARFTGEPSP